MLIVELPFPAASSFEVDSAMAVHRNIQSPVQTKQTIEAYSLHGSLRREQNGATTLAMKVGFHSKAIGVIIAVPIQKLEIRYVTPHVAFASMFRIRFVVLFGRCVARLVSYMLCPCVSCMLKCES